MRILSILVGLFIAASSFGANPSFQDFYGTNGIVIRTNGNKVQVDGTNLFGLKVVVLGGNNTTVTLGSTNGTNFYAVDSAGGGGGGSTNATAPIFGQLTSSALTQSYGSGSRTNNILFASTLTNGMATSASGNGVFPYSGLLVLDAGYYQVFGEAYLSATGSVSIVLATNGIENHKFWSQANPITIGNTADIPMAFSGVEYFPAGVTVAFLEISTPAQAVGVSDARIGMVKIETVFSGGSGGGSATNAVVSIMTNGVYVLSTGTTNINFIGATGMVQGSSVIIGGYSTGASGATVDPITNRYASANIFTNLGGLRQGGMSIFTGVVTNKAAVQIDTTLNVTLAAGFSNDVSMSGTVGAGTLFATNTATFQTNTQQRGTNYAAWIALPNVATNLPLTLNSRSNIVAMPLGSGLSVVAGALTATAGSNGGTNYPPAIQKLAATNVTVGVGVRQLLTWITNASFAMNFIGTPNSGETVIVGVSNNSASVIFVTNMLNGTVTDYYHPIWGSNYNIWPVFPTNIAWREFVWGTNFGSGGVRQELVRDVSLERALVAGSNIAFATNGNEVSISASGGGTLTTVKTNGVDVSTTVTSLDIITGSNTLVQATNAAGAVTVQINGSSGGGGIPSGYQTNQFTTNVSGTPVLGGLWLNGTNSITPPFTNGGRVGLEWTPVQRALRIGELGNTGTGPDGFDSTTISSNYWHATNIGFGSVAFGSNVMAKGPYSFIGNGIFNITHSNAVASSITGGSNNIIYTNVAFGHIGGGAGNTIRMNSHQATVGGGRDNDVIGSIYGTVGGGQANDIGNGSTHATIGGGSVNLIGNGTVTSEYSTIAGGRNNQADSPDSFIGGGQQNVINSAANTGSTISGGTGNNVNQGSSYATVGGGSNNDIGVTGVGDADYGTIGGGQDNIIGGVSDWSVISGGHLNLISVSSQYAQILGGVSNNVATADMAGAVGWFITNSTIKSIEMGHGNQRKIRVDVNGLKVNVFSNTLGSVGGTLSVQTTPIASAGASETNLMSYSVERHNLTNSSDRLKFRASGNFAATANTKQIKVVYGSETILDTGAQIVNTGSWVIDGEIIRTGSTAQTANANYHGAGVTLFTTASAVSLAQTNGIATTLKITSTAAGNGDVTNRTMVVEWFPAP